jgi:hypothetical protein
MAPSPGQHVEGDSLKVTDDYSAANAANPAGRISLEDIEARVWVVHYLNAGDAVTDSGMDPSGAERRLTLALLTLDNGFCVVGKSAPMDPANFDQTKGQRFAYEDAVRQLWPLMAFSRLDNAPAVGDDVDDVAFCDLREPETGD